MAKTYQSFVKSSNLEKGDLVLIKRKTTDFANGWQNIWNTDMSKGVNKIGTILTQVDDPRGVKIEGEGINKVRFYPIFVLEKIEHRVGTLKISAEKIFKFLKNNKAHMCRPWIDEITKKFDIINHDEFFVDINWLALAYNEADDFLKEQINLLFPEWNITTRGYYDEDLGETIDSMEDFIDSYITSELELAIPGGSNRERALTIIELISKTYLK